MATMLDRLKKQMTAAKKEFVRRRRLLDKQYRSAVNALEREYEVVFSVKHSSATKQARRKPARRTSRKYGSVRASILKALAGGASLRTAEIAKKAKLGLPQTRAALFSLKKQKQVRSKAGAYELVASNAAKKA